VRIAKISDNYEVEVKSRVEEKGFSYLIVFNLDETIGAKID